MDRHLYIVNTFLSLCSLFQVSPANFMKLKKIRPETKKRLGHWIPLDDESPQMAFLVCDQTSVN